MKFCRLQLKCFLYCLLTLSGGYPFTMDFSTLHQGSDCDCIASAHQNCSDTFSRKTSDGKVPKDRNFKISIEKQNAIYDDCENHCNEKSTSIDLWKDESADIVIKFHQSKIARGISPRLKDHLLIFKIKVNGGYVKSTPVKGNDFHHNYYLPDDFSAETSIEFIKKSPPCQCCLMFPKIA
jgi:hypothetical protein